MPPPRKPHPRSLDALFGKPKPRVKLCPKGHRQGVRWKTGDACLECATIAARAARDAEAKAEKARWREQMGPVPAVIRMTTWDTKRVVTLAIPPALAAQKKRAELKRRGRRRAARI